MTSTTSAQQVVTKHPVRGAIWGLLLGIGLAMYAVLFAVIPFTDWVPLILVVLVGVAIGVGWAFLAPAKRPSDAAPAPVEPAAAQDQAVQPDPVADTPHDSGTDADDVGDAGGGDSGSGDGGGGDGGD